MEKEYAAVDKSETHPKSSIFARINILINKLPFNRFASKIPIIQKFSKYANYVVCALAVVLLVGIFTAKSPIDSFISDMEYIVESMENTVDECEAGEITFSEMQEQMRDLVSEIDEIGEKYKGKFKDSDWTPEQKNRVLKIMNDIERLEAKGDRLMY